MPMPEPHSGESRDAFIERFMSSPSMAREYPDIAQRMAVAVSQWKQSQRKRG
jgi:hypothetical protein